VWSKADGEFTVSSMPAAHKYNVTTAYEKNLNWQDSATYAEEGKSKEVIGYYDGVLRNRQNVTRVSSDRNTIIGETIYDHLGRPVIQVLPTPTDFNGCTQGMVANVLRYYPNFNTNEASAPYSWLNFDLVSNQQDCDIPVSPLSTSSGASRYYSPANPEQSEENNFIPDAEGFPFSQVEYTADNTGRIKSQSGVGREFKMNSGHETKYYYGRPDQIQLDRMFGSEVGIAEHYQKNMVVDPNGQVSISYLDQEGRVIATSLAGSKPRSMNELSTANSTVQLTESLLVKDTTGNVNNNQRNNATHSWVFSQNILVSSPTNLELKYDLQVPDFTDPCLAESICFSCVYDLQIKVVDDCGVDYTPTNQYGRKTVTGRFTSTNGVLGFTTACNQNDFNMVNKDTVLLSLPIGSYSISKVLTVNQAAIDFYVEKYMDSTVNTCVKTLSDFTQEYLEGIDYSDCFPVLNCDSCLMLLGTLESFVGAGRGTEADYLEQKEGCELMCKEPYGCDSYYQMLVSDISPDGQ
jgi:hypothetical protein